MTKHHYEDWPPEEWRTLYRDIIASINFEPGSSTAQALADRWLTIALKRDILDGFSRRRQWPNGMRRYMASLYEMDVDTWQRVTDFIERTHRMHR